MEDYSNDLLANVSETVEKEINQFLTDFETAMIVMSRKSLSTRITFAEEFRDATMVQKTKMIMDLIEEK